MNRILPPPPQTPPPFSDFDTYENEGRLRSGGLRRCGAEEPVVVAAVKLVSSTCGARIVSSRASAIWRGHANFANVSDARPGRSAKFLEKTEVPLPIYIISAKRIPTQLPHQSCGTLEIFAAVPSAELNMMTATLVFGFGDKSFQTVS